MDLLNQSQFAKRCEVSRQSIAKAVKNSQLRVVEQDGKKFIDTHDALSVRYINNQNINRTSAQVKKGLIDKKIVKKLEPKDDDPDFDDDDDGGVPIDVDVFDDKDRKNLLLTNAKLNQEKTKVQINKIKIETAQKLSILIPRAVVEKSFDRMNAIILNYLFPLGGRVAPKIAGFFESTDQETVRKIENEINKEMMRGIEAFKTEAAESVVKWKKEKLIK